MPSVNVDIGQGYYESDALPLANQKCVNLYVQAPQTSSLFPVSLFGTPGLRRVAITGRKNSDKNRGAWVKGGIPYFVNGDKIYSLDSSFNYTELGEVEGSARCSFADNGAQLLVLEPGGKGYIVDETATPVVQEITDTDFTTTNGAPQYVVFIDGYFVASTDAGKFIVSNINDGMTWDALDFGSAEVDPDGIVAPFVFKNQLYIAGTNTTEAFQNIGGAGFPFQRINGFVFDTGVLAPASIAVFNNTVLWVGKGEREGAAVWRLNGSQPQKVSTTAIDTQLQSLTLDEQKAIFSWTYSQNGNYFVGFTSEYFTFVYDLSTGKWHERESQITNALGNVVSGRCRYNSVVEAYGSLLVGDSRDGRIGVIDPGVYDEYDEVLPAYFTTSPLFNLGNSFTIPNIEIFCQPGTGNADKREPVVNIRISKDGYTFGDYRTLDIGSTGKYKTRQILRHVGRVARYCVMEFRINDMVERRFMGLVVNYKPGVRGG